MHPSRQLKFQKKKIISFWLGSVGISEFFQVVGYNHQRLFYVILLSYCSQWLETNMQPLRWLEKHQQAEKKRFLGKQKKKKTSTSAQTDHRWKGQKQNAWKADGSGSPQGGVPGEGGQAGDGRGGSRKLGCSTTLRFLTSWSILSDLFWSFWWLWRRSGQPAKEKPAWTKQSLQTRLVCVFCNDPLSCPKLARVVGTLHWLLCRRSTNEFLTLSTRPNETAHAESHRQTEKSCSVLRVERDVSCETVGANFTSSAGVCSGSLSCWCCSCLLGPVAPPLVSRRCSRPCSFIFCSMSSCLHFFNLKKHVSFFVHVHFFSLFHFSIFSAAMRFPVAALASGFSLPKSLSATWRVPR